MMALTRSAHRPQGGRGEQLSMGLLWNRIEGLAPNQKRPQCAATGASTHHLSLPDEVLRL
jgi:hypothetical protein